MNGLRINYNIGMVQINGFYWEVEYIVDIDKKEAQLQSTALLDSIGKVIGEYEEFLDISDAVID